MNRFDEIYNKIINEQIKFPKFLYHATYKPLLENIQKFGLGNTQNTFWDDSVPGVVYLANDPYVAESYAETNENCDEEWLDQIVVLKINVDDLDKSKLQIDKNVLDNDGSTYEYHGIITKFEILE